jgi:hypothetical protein
MMVSHRSEVKVYKVAYGQLVGGPNRAAPTKLMSKAVPTR